MATDYYETLGQEDIDFGIGIVAKRNPGGGTLTTTQVNLSSLGLTQLTVEAAWTPAVNSVPAGSEIDTTITVQGALSEDFVMVAFDGMGSSILQLTGHVSNTDTVTVVLSNSTAVGQPISAGTLRVLVFRTR